MIMGVGMALFLAFMIFKSIGFKNLFAFFKVKMKVRKGWGLVLIFQRTGYPMYIPIQFEGETLKPFGEDGGRYVFKSHCVYQNEFGIPTIAYRKDDANPIDFKTGIQTNTSPNVLENILAKALKAEKEYAGDFISFLKKHWLKILIFYLGPLAILGFVVLNQQDALTQMAQTAGRQVIINASSIGR